jgi:phosphoribosylformylglycinamidine cyclo-ligase
VVETTDEEGLTMGKDYEALGVDAQKAAVHAAIADQDKGLYPGAFCKIVPDDLTGSEEHCIIMHGDGAGTKASAAYVADRVHHEPEHWLDWGDNIWRHLAQDALAMNLDDMACAGARGPFLVSNMISRNVTCVRGGVVKALIDGYQQVCDTMSSLGIPCRLTGGETADVADLVRTLTVDCTVVARLRRDQVVDCSRIRPGDLIVGFSSTGKANWESAPNSGIGANGLTLARHVLMSRRYREQFPESFSPELDPNKIFRGRYLMSESICGGLFEMGEALLAPTRIYLPLILRLLERFPPERLHGLIHCTGGGQTKIRKFGGPGLYFCKNNPFPIPPFFHLIQQEGQISWREMYEVFNMGWRLEAVVKNTVDVGVCIELARECGIKARIVGEVLVQSKRPAENIVGIIHQEPLGSQVIYYPMASEPHTDSP